MSNVDFNNFRIPNTLPNLIFWALFLEGIFHYYCKFLDFCVTLSFVCYYTAQIANFYLLQTYLSYHACIKNSWKLIYCHNYLEQNQVAYVRYKRSWVSLEDGAIKEFLLKSCKSSLDNKKKIHRWEAQGWSDC